MDPKGQAAIVTGGASGLGAATAQALAAAGAKVALLDVNLEAAQQMAAKIGGIAIRCDVADAKSGEDAIAQAKAKHGAARILVNCAGIGPAKRILGRDGVMPLEDYERVIRINLIGSFNVLRLAAAAMVDNAPDDAGERGVHINTASIAAYDGQIGQVAYSASKGGIVGLTLPAARDLASRGVRVMTIAPGTFDTPLLAALPQEARDELGAQVPFPSRLGQPDEFAALARHIVENPMLNGETIRLDGALRMPPR